jgi:hypothetical protein
MGLCLGGTPHSSCFAFATAVLNRQRFDCDVIDMHAANEPFPGQMERRNNAFIVIEMKGFGPWTHPEDNAVCIDPGTGNTLRLSFLMTGYMATEGHVLSTTAGMEPHRQLLLAALAAGELSFWRYAPA